MACQSDWRVGILIAFVLLIAVELFGSNRTSFLDSYESRSCAASTSAGVGVNDCAAALAVETFAIGVARIREVKPVLHRLASKA